MKEPSKNITSVLFKKKQGPIVVCIAIFDDVASIQASLTQASYYSLPDTTNDRHTSQTAICVSFLLLYSFSIIVIFRSISLFLYVVRIGMLAKLSGKPEVIPYLTAFAYPQTGCYYLQ